MKSSAIVPFFETLRDANPEPASELEYASMFELLAAVLLSAQATDKGVNKATRRLFAVAPTPEKMIALGLPAIEDAIKTIGLFRNKAKNLLATCAHPRRRSTAAACRARARRSRRCPASAARPPTSSSTTPSATRRSRSTRTSFASRTAPASRPAETCSRSRCGLLERVPEPFLANAHHWLILHGRYVCQAKRPLCEVCAWRGRPAPSRLRRRGGRRAKVSRRALRRARVHRSARHDDVMRQMRHGDPATSNGDPDRAAEHRDDAVQRRIVPRPSPTTAPRSITTSAVGEQRQRQVVQHAHDRLARAHLARTQPHQRHLVRRVEMRRRLVEQQQRRVDGERAREQHALALAARELVQAAVLPGAAFGVGHRAVDARLVVGARRAEEAEARQAAERDGLARREFAAGVALLRRARRCGGARSRGGQSRSGRSSSRTSPRSGRCRPASVAQQRRLAGAVRADDRGPARAARRGRRRARARVPPSATLDAACARAGVIACDRRRSSQIR